MDASYFVGLVRESLWMILLVSAPIVLPALVVGLVLGMIQAATSINEATLSFVPKLFVVLVAIGLFGSLMMGLLTDFTQTMFARIPDVVR